MLLLAKASPFMYIREKGSLPCIIAAPVLSEDYQSFPDDYINAATFALAFWKGTITTLGPAPIPIRGSMTGSCNITGHRSRKRRNYASLRSNSLLPPRLPTTVSTPISRRQ